MFPGAGGSEKQQRGHLGGRGEEEKRSGLSDRLTEYLGGGRKRGKAKGADKHAVLVSVVGTLKRLGEQGRCPIRLSLGSPACLPPSDQKRHGLLVSTVGGVGAPTFAPMRPLRDPCLLTAGIPPGS